MGRKPREQDESGVWLREFGTFLREPGVAPPKSVEQLLLSFVRAELNPPLRLWGTKLLVIHCITALLFTAICPQLGVGPFIADVGLGHIFMTFGQLPCTALCGAMFLGLTALASSVLLNREELRVANRHRILNVSILAAISFSGLLLAGGSSDRLNYLFWLLGAVISGWSVLTVGSWLRLGEGISPRVVRFLR